MFTSYLIQPVAMIYQLNGFSLKSNHFSLASNNFHSSSDQVHKCRNKITTHPTVYTSLKLQDFVIETIIPR